MEKRSDSRRFGLLALHRATFLTSQHVSEAGPSRVQAPVGEAGRVPDAAKRPRSRTRQAFPQTQAAGTPLSECAPKGHVAVFQLLLDAGASPDAGTVLGPRGVVAGATPLFEAVASFIKLMLLIRRFLQPVSG